MSDFRIDQITNQAGTAGPQIAGITTFSGSSGLLMPSGDTSRRYVSDFVPNNLITDGLVLYLDASITQSYSGSGTVWTDLSGQGNNGTLVNGVGFSADQGGSLEFDGDNDYVLIDVNEWIRSRSSSYTFSSYLYYNDSTGGGSYFSLLNSPNPDNGSDGFWQHMNLSGSWLWRTEDAITGESGGTAISPSPFSDGNWYYVTVVISTNQLEFYVNASLIATASPTFSWANLRTDRPAYLYIATGYGDAIGYYMKGKISNFYIHDRILTQQEIQQNFNALKGRYGL